MSAKPREFYIQVLVLIGRRVENESNPECLKILLEEQRELLSDLAVRLEEERD
jgi:hypothetical protein